MAEFFAMGGHAVYVWSAYAVAAAVLIAMLAATLVGLRRREALLRALEDGRPRRRRERLAAEAGTADAGTIPEGGRR
jgi:heme exporter protein D